jgi:hypothetical protein
MPGPRFISIFNRPDPVPRPNETSGAVNALRVRSGRSPETGPRSRRLSGAGRNRVQAGMWKRPRSAVGIRSIGFGIVPLWLVLVHSAAAGPGRSWNPQAPPASQGSSFSFVILGDRTGAGPDSWGILDRAVAETNRLKPDFTVHIGDLIDGGSSPGMTARQWDEVAGHLDSLRTPLFLVPGNHDVSDPAGRAAWTERFGPTRRSFDFAASRFIFLDTETPSAAGRGGLGAGQTDFLRRALRAEPRPRRIFIFMHRPAWIFDGPLKREWESALTDAGSVPVFAFAGHLHLLAAERRGSVLCTVVGPTGGSLRLAPNPALGLLQHITRVRSEGDSTRIEFLDSGGRVLPETAAFDAAERGLKTFLLLRRSAGEW